jgi:hypothetical protein
MNLTKYSGESGSNISIISMLRVKTEASVMKSKECCHDPKSFTISPLHPHLPLGK